MMHRSAYALLIGPLLASRANVQLLVLHGLPNQKRRKRNEKTKLEGARVINGLVIDFQR
jgi:hypothetical protein